MSNAHGRRPLRWSMWRVALVLFGWTMGCGAPPSNDAALRGTIGVQGGELVGEKGTALEGVRMVIPAGALSGDTQLEIKVAAQEAQLPGGAVRVGPQLEISPAGTVLAQPVQLTVPFDQNLVEANHRLADEVGVWRQNGTEWGDEALVGRTAGRVTAALSGLSQVMPGVTPPSPPDVVEFELFPSVKFVPCFEKDPDHQPSVQVTVVRGNLNDTLFLRGVNFKPGLKFDLFTIQNSSLLANGQPDPNFKNFGLAWYQSDLEADVEGNLNVDIRTILLDQIFGFDPAVGLAPTNTFHVGFWFNSPEDAANCGFDVTKPTPFNGEHRAGPNAMISVPNADTGLGPLCSNPDTSTTPARCNP
jgi:hypothetical protein